METIAKRRFWALNMTNIGRIDSKAAKSRQSWLCGELNRSFGLFCDNIWHFCKAFRERKSCRLKKLFPVFSCGYLTASGNIFKLAQNMLYPIISFTVL
jgi:hypothetical protein